MTLLACQKQLYKHAVMFTQEWPYTGYAYTSKV